MKLIRFIWVCLSKTVSMTISRSSVFHKKCTMLFPRPVSEKTLKSIVNNTLLYFFAFVIEPYFSCRFDIQSKTKLLLPYSWAQTIDVKTIRLESKCLWTKNYKQREEERRRQTIVSSDGVKITLDVFFLWIVLPRDAKKD